MLYEQDRRLRKLARPDPYRLDLIGPEDREALSDFLDYVEHLHRRIEQESRTAERAGDELSWLRAAVGRIVESLGHDTEDMDDREMIEVLMERTGESIRSRSD